MKINERVPQKKAHQKRRKSLSIETLSMKEKKIPSPMITLAQGMPKITGRVKTPSSLSPLTSLKSFIGSAKVYPMIKRAAIGRGKGVSE